MEDFFSGENEKPRKDYFSFKEIGDKITGVYIGAVKNDVRDKYGKLKMEYIFKTMDGYKFVSGRSYKKGDDMTNDYAILYPMLDAKPGTVMGLKYKEDKDCGKGNAFKVIDAIYPDEPQELPEAIKEFKDKLGSFYDLEAGEQKEQELSSPEEVDANFPELE